MAGTIDQLNFEVILDDKEFTAKVQQDIKLANQLNTSLSSLLNIKKQVGKFNQDDVNNNRKAQQILKDNARAQEAITREKIKTEGVQKKINAQIERATKGYQSQSRILNELKGYMLGYLSIHGAGQLLSSLVRVTGEFELQKTTLAAMLGDLNAAEGVITRIQGLAVESPFQFKELTTYAKQLSAFSVPAQELYDTTKMLADISAGLGVGMDRIVLAYGQVRSAAFLRGQEVRQFTEAGIPILNELAKQFSELEGRAVSTGEVFDKISKRLVPFEMVAKVFKDMTSEGGKFYNMQEVQAETLKGKISNLKDAYEVMLNEIGKGQSENLKGAVDWARRLMQNYEETGRTLVELVSAYGAYRGALIASDVAAKVFLGTNKGVVASLINVGKALSANPYVAIAAALATAGLVVYKTATSLESYEKVQNSVLDTQKKYASSVAKETATLDALYAKLKFAKEGTEEYADARKQIYSQYSGYIAELKNEGIAVDDLTKIYGNLKEKIEQSAEARFRVTAARNLDTTYDTEMDKMFKKYERLTKNIENFIDRTLSANEKEGLWQYLIGNDTILNDNPELHGLSNAIEQYIKKGTGVSITWLKTQIRKVINEYTEGKKKIDALFGEEPPQDIEENPFVYDLDQDTPSGKSPAQKAIEEQIRSVQKLQDAYEKLLPYLNEVQMKSTLKSLFPNIEEGIIDSLDFDAELGRLADRLEEFDKDAAQRLRDTIGKNVAGTIVESFEAIAKYKTMLDSWLGEDFSLSGEGVSFDISKIVRNLNNEYAKIDKKRLSALNLLAKAEAGDVKALAVVREKYGEEVWREYLENGRETIEKLVNLEKAAAKKTAEENIRDTANRYVTEKLARQNIDLSDFGDKNINQIETILNRLRDLVTKTKLEMATLYFGGLDENEKLRLEGLSAVLDILQIKIDDTSEELDKKLGDKVVDVVNTLGDSLTSVGNEMQNLGEEIDSHVLSSLGKALSEYGDFAKEISSAIKGFAEEVKGVDWENTSFKDLSEGAKGGLIGLIASMATFVYGKIADVITRTYEQQRLLNEASAEYAERLMNIRRQSYSGVFGTDEMALAEENAKILDEAQERYQGVIDKFNKMGLKRVKQGGSIVSFQKTSVADIMGDISDAQGWDLYLENGELNIDALESYYDAYSNRLTNKQREVVLELIEQGNLYNDAAAQSAEYLTSIFSEAADSIASDMVDAFIESGDAAVDMRNYVSDAAKQMAADLIKTLYLLPIMSDYASKLTEIANDETLSPDKKTEMALNLFQMALSEIEGQRDAINSTLGQIEQYFEAAEEAESGTTDLGQGIKGITEDQANLLASYLNAIRADVSFSKTLWIKMDANLQRIADMFTSSPTLMEYQAQIAANTYNTAIATQEILAELRSVVTTDSGDTAIRVYS